jgi:hypothetical protein
MFFPGFFHATDIFSILRGAAGKAYAPQRARYSGSDLREIRRSGQAHECARRRAQSAARLAKAR